MIPQELEKLILRGKAVYSVHTHAWSSFGAIQVPKDKLVIITNIKWNYFINPYENTDSASSVRNSLRFNEYQLKVESAKSKTFFQYRNGVAIDPLTGGTSVSTWSSIINARPWPFIVMPPDYKDVYIVCSDFIKLTITRNAFIETFGSTNGAVSQLANEQAPPNGVNGVSLIKRMALNSKTPQNMWNTPAGDAYAGLASPGARNTQSYSQDIDPNYSLIYPPDAGVCQIIGFPYVTNPCVEFGIVTVNSNDYNDLINT